MTKKGLNYKIINIVIKLLKKDFDVFLEGIDFTYIGILF